jgi:hypothetical protein
VWKAQTPQELIMPSTISMKKLLETGVHFGHRTTKWNPRMEEFIFDARNGIHIIDLRKTFSNLNAYYDIVRDTIANGGIVLFVGTKRQAQESIQREASRCGHAVCEYSLVGRHAHQLAHHSRPYRSAEEAGKIAGSWRIRPPDEKRIPDEDAPD